MNEEVPTFLSSSVQIIADEEFMPKYAHPDDAGMDLRADIGNYYFVFPGEVKAISTGVRLNIPRGVVGLVHPRSGLALKGISVANAPGTIDAGYQGEVKVLITNHSDKPFKIKRGDRIAQIVFLPIVVTTLVPVTSFEETSARGEGGFGSTGVE